MQAIEQTLDSREVAEMVDKEHKFLMRDIRRYITQITEGNEKYGGGCKVAPSDFFTEETYRNSQNKELPCYRITKKGCEFISNKLTGTKGTIFTARYINRFHEMEDFLSGKTQAVAPVQPDQMQMLSQKQEKLEKELGKIKSDLHRLSLNKCVPVFSVTYNGRYPYKNMIMAMLEKVDDVGDEIFLSQMYTLFKKHMEKCMR